MDYEFQQNLIKAKRCHQDGEWTQAQYYYELVLRQEPENFICLANLAHLLNKLKKFIEAEDICRRLLRRQNTNAHVWYNLAAAQFGQRQWDDALDSIREALLQKPKFSEAVLLRGQIMLELQDIITAINCFNQAIVWNKSLLSAHLILLSCLCDLGRWQEAALCFNKARTLFPKEFELYYCSLVI